MNRKFFQMKGPKPLHLKRLNFLICVLDQKLQIMSHLTLKQRYTIDMMNKQGYTQIDIAQAIEKDKSVVSRELKRNCDRRSGIYRHELAQRKYEKRQKGKPKRIAFTTSIQAEVEDLLQQDYSPEQIVGISEKLQKVTVSVERIYQHVWEDKKKGGSLFLHLRHRGRHYRKRGSAKDSRGIIKNRVDIEKRPEIVEKRTRFGDLEVDLIIGKHHKQAILTINDRASGMLKMKKVPSKAADVVSQAIVETLQDWMPYIHTITGDNGKEFAGHQEVSEQLGIQFYFAKPYHAWQRGSNENLNGLIRQYFKKSTDFHQITDQQIKNVEDKLNNRPRKRFNYENPTFVMNQFLFKPKVAFVT